MSDKLHFFVQPDRCTAAALPFNLTERLEQWAGLRREMVRAVAKPFARDEWAYLVSFLDESNLRRPFLETFGEQIQCVAGGGAHLSSTRRQVAPVALPRRVEERRALPPQTQSYLTESLTTGPHLTPDVLLRPRGTIAVWLPSTVSLLGPLTLILASLSGAPLWFKAGSQAEDLTRAFLEYALGRLPAGALAYYLREQVRVEHADRHSPVNAEMAAAAKVRVVFGSDAAVAAIQKLPHPADSVAISFGDHCSEAWIESEALTDEQAMVLVRVFAIYGRAGCTSPCRVVVLSGSEADARALQQRLVGLWPKAVRADVPMHVASMNIMEAQLGSAQGWHSVLAPRNAAVLMSGPSGVVEPVGLMSLAVVPATPAEAVAALPPNIQTVGHCLRQPGDPAWLELVASSAIKRFVPLAAMHHFGPVWDGSNFWRQFFEEVVLRA